MDRAIATDDDLLIGPPIQEFVYVVGSVKWKRGPYWPRAIEFSPITKPPTTGNSLVYTLFIQRKPGDPKTAIYGSFTERVTWDATQWSPRAVSQALSKRMREVDTSLRHGSTAVSTE